MSHTRNGVLEIRINDVSLKLHEMYLPDIKAAELLSSRLTKICLELDLTEAQAYKVLLDDLPAHLTPEELKIRWSNLSYTQQTLIKTFIPTESFARSFNSLYRNSKNEKSFFSNSNLAILHFIKKGLLNKPEIKYGDFYQESIGNLLLPPSFGLSEINSAYPKNFFSLANQPPHICSFVELFKRSYFPTVESFFKFLCSAVKEQLNVLSPHHLCAPGKPREINSPQPQKSFCFRTKDNKYCLFKNGKLKFYPIAAEKNFFNKVKESLFQNKVEEKVDNPDSSRQNDLVRIFLTKQIKKMHLKFDDPRTFVTVINELFDFLATELGMTRDEALELKNNEIQFSLLNHDEKIVIRHFVKSSSPNLEHFLKSKFESLSQSTENSNCVSSKKTI